MRQSSGVLGDDRPKRVGARAGSGGVRVGPRGAAKETKAVAGWAAVNRRWVLRPLKVPAPLALRVATCVCANVLGLLRLSADACVFIERPDLCLAPPGGYCRSFTEQRRLPEARLVVLSGVGPLLGDLPLFVQLYKICARSEVSAVLLVIILTVLSLLFQSS